MFRLCFGFLMKAFHTGYPSAFLGLLDPICDENVHATFLIKRHALGDSLPPAMSDEC